MVPGRNNSKGFDIRFMGTSLPMFFKGPCTLVSSIPRIHHTSGLCKGKPVKRLHDGGQIRQCGTLANLLAGNIKGI